MKCRSKMSASPLRRRSKKVYISVIGGFGNNLFQIAAGFAFEDLGYKVRFDLSAVKSKKLEVLDIPVLGDYFTERVAAFTRFIPSPIGKLGFITRWFSRCVLGATPWINLDSNGNLPIDYERDYFLSGYWQSVETASHLPRFEYFKAEMKSNKVAIHIRRGDMIVNLIQPMDEYFKSCLAQIISENPGRIFDVVVYTDDYEYCNSELDLSHSFEVKSGGSTLDDFLGLIDAEYLIMSRSTFSWWAGYMSIGKVFSPMPWNKSRPQDNRVTFLKNWKLIPSK